MKHPIIEKKDENGFESVEEVDGNSTYISNNGKKIISS